MIFFQRKTTLSYDDSITVINQVFSMARFIGISQIGLNMFFIWTVIILIMLLVIEVCAIWKVIICLMELANNRGGGIVGRLAGVVFYGNALLSLLLSIKFINSWKYLSLYWIKLETGVGLKLPIDIRIRKRIIIVSSFILICAIVEHIMSMMSATGLDCPVQEYFKRYILASHGFLLHSYDYTIYIAVPLFLMSKVATLLWNFQDLIIIMISMGLTSRYHRLNTCVQQVVRNEIRNRNVDKLGTDTYIQMQVWRRLREGYVYQAALVRQVDTKLGPLILLSNVNNLYFICLQLFLGIGNLKGDFIHALYYFLSLSWMIFRACSVVLAASDVHEYSRNALSILYKCPPSGYNVEIKRLINQLTHDNVVLSGMGYFNLKRQLMLEVAATILKYELVILQYDTSE